MRRKLLTAFPGRSVKNFIILGWLIEETMFSECFGKEIAFSGSFDQKFISKGRFVKET